MIRFYLEHFTNRASVKKCDVPITTNEPETNLRERLLFETGFETKLRDESMWPRQEGRGGGGYIFVEFY